jgi:hypothetical protein
MPSKVSNLGPAAFERCDPDALFAEAMSVDIPESVRTVPPPGWRTSSAAPLNFDGAWVHGVPLERTVVERRYSRLSLEPGESVVVQFQRPLLSGCIQEVTGYVETEDCVPPISVIAESSLMYGTDHYRSVSGGITGVSVRFHNESDVRVKFRPVIRWSSTSEVINAEG